MGRLLSKVEYVWDTSYRITIERKTMLTENDVICAVARHLRDKGWQIENVSTTDQRGFDILARKGPTSLVVEAKGGTSSKRGTNRYGKCFDRTQKGKHVSVALYWAARVISDGQHDIVGIALPADKDHKELIDKILTALKTLGVVVYLVHPDHRVVVYLAHPDRSIEDTNSERC